jgi:hypothetical protein
VGEGEGGGGGKDGSTDSSAKIRNITKRKAEKK